MSKHWTWPDWFQNINRHTVRQDFFSGLTGAIVVLPQGVAFAGIAGLPPQYGLYTAMVPAIIAGLLGSSHHLISGPTTTLSIVVFATLAPLAEPASQPFIVLALTLAFLAGLIQLFLGLARLGAVVNFVSHSVVVGFTCGAAILIASSQMKHLLGIPLPSGSSFLETWTSLMARLPEINPYTLAVGMTTLLTAILIERFLPRLPDMLLAMGVGSLLAAMLGATEHAIALVGPLPSNLPPLSLPNISFDTVRTLSSGALAIAVLGLIEAISIARSIALKSGQRIDGNREFIGQGVSNMVGSFFSAYPSSGSFTRSGINHRSGAKTPLSAVFAALLLMVVLLFVAPLAAYLPIAAMAGIILKVAYKLIDFHHIKTIVRLTKPGLAVMSATFFSTLFLELEFAIYAGVLLSLSIYLSRTSHPKVVSRVPNPTSPWRTLTTDPTFPECPQLKIVRIDGPLFFGSVGYVEEALEALRKNNPDQQCLLMVGSGINFVDLAGLETLVHTSQGYRESEGHFFLLDVQDQVCGMFRKSGYIDSIGREHIFPSTKEAITTIVSRYMDPQRCRRCPHPVFLECAPGGEETDHGAVGISSLPDEKASQST